MFAFDWLFGIIGISRAQNIWVRAPNRGRYCVEGFRCTFIGGPGLPRDRRGILRVGWRPGGGTGD